MTLTIAGVTLVLGEGLRPLADRLGGRYGRFAAAEGTGPALVLDVRLDPARLVPGLHPEFVDNPPLRAEGDLERAAIEGDGFEAVFDWSGGRVTGVIPDSLAHFDLLARIALGVALLREGGTLLHASGVLRDRFGIAFSGPSGAGKSTAVRLSREAGLDVLADEMLVFRRSGLGARLYGTPFWDGAPLSGPAGAILFLVQADAHRVEHLPPDRGLPRLLAAGGAPLALPAVQAAFFEACAAMLRRVPSYLLEFRPDAGFWDVLDRLPEFAYFRNRPAATATMSPVPLRGLGRTPPAGH